MTKSNAMMAMALALALGCAPERNVQTESAGNGTIASAQAQARGGDAVSLAEKLASRAWVLVGLGEAGDPPGLSDPVTLQMDAAGKLNGFGGCNRYHSSYQLGDAGNVTFTAVAATRMACPAPIMQVEQRYFDALGRARRLAIEGDRLVLSDDTGRRLLEYRGEPEDPRWVPPPAEPGNPGRP